MINADNLSSTSFNFKSLLPVIPGPAIYFALDQAIQKKATETWDLTAAYFSIAAAKIADFSSCCFFLLREVKVLGRAALRAANCCWIAGVILNLASIAINIQECRESTDFQRIHSATLDASILSGKMAGSKVQKYFKVDIQTLGDTLVATRKRIGQNRHGDINKILNARIDQVNRARTIGNIAALVFLVGAAALAMGCGCPVMIPILALGYGLLCVEWYNNRSDGFLDKLNKIATAKLS